MDFANCPGEKTQAVLRGVVVSLFVAAPFAFGSLGDDLTAYWSFDHTLADLASTILGSGNTVDDDLSIVGTGSGFGSAKFGSAGYVGDGNGHPETPDSADVDEDGNTISISAWIRVASFDRSWQAAVSKGEGQNYRIHRRNSDDFMAFSGGTGSDIFGVGTDVNDGQWHHLVATSGPVDGARFYVDGVEVVHDGGSVSLDNTNNPLMIGNNPDQTLRKWNGGIDDVAIWHRVLTAAEVSQIYSANQSIGDLLSYDPGGDEDFDGLPNGWEILNGLDPDDGTGDNGPAGDPDLDALTNLAEFNFGTDPTDADTDDDLLLDGVEIHTTMTSPLSADTDGDDIRDGEEIYTHGTNPLLVDTDGDGAADGLELIFGTNPTSSAETPPAGSSLYGLTSVGVIGPYLDGDLPSLKPSEEIGENWNVGNAFTNLSFADLKGVVSEPRSSNIHVIERRGTVQRVDASDPDTAIKTKVLDVSSLTVDGDNGGLRSVVFHPEFNEVGSSNRNYLYCFYSTTASTDRGFSNGNGDFFYRLSRFTRDEGTGLFPLTSELVLIQQRSLDHGQHFGGGLAFDGDGFLNISWGDMEFNSGRVGVPFYQDAQRIDRIFQAAVLRIDVDNQGGLVSQAATRTLQGSSGPWGVAGTSQSCSPSHHYYHIDNFSGRDYMIPSDNFFLNNPPAAGTPFADTPVHGLPLDEHQALGVRNPWRMAVDPVDGDIAMFNVGSNSGADFEEVEILSPGANFGWPYREGTTSQTSETGREKPPAQYGPLYVGTETDAAAFWAHPDGGTVSTGGLFYRGTRWAQINAELIFADHNSGKIWALNYKDSGPQSGTRATSDGVSVPDNYSVRLLVDSSLSIRQMAAGPDGNEIYIAANGGIHRLFNALSVNPEPPALLSETGAFSNLANLTPRAGLVPFTPESTLWSDRAIKQRWIAVPNSGGTPGQYDLADEKITYSHEGEWQYPKGTVFVKHFALPIDLRDPSVTRPVETRFLVHGEDGVYFYFTYQWRADGSDADLLLAGSTSDYNVVLENGTDSVQRWTFPTRANCLECHQAGAGHVLGMKSRQLNHSKFYSSTGVTANQLTTFAGLGLFDTPPAFESLPTALKSAAIADPHVSLNHRVRSYLDSNCSNCHRPESNADRANMDLRLTTPLALSGILNVDPLAGDLGVAGAKIILPGQPEKSVFYLRDSATNEDLMPPIGRTLNDPHYVPELYSWIQRLGYSEYDSWANASSIVGNMNDDSDTDEVPNVLEFVLGGSGDLSTLPRVIDPGSGDLEISIPISGAALTDGLALSVEGSTDLINWYPIDDVRSGLILLSNSSAPGINGVMKIGLAVGNQVFVRYGVQVP